MFLVCWSNIRLPVMCQLWCWWSWCDPKVIDALGTITELGGCYSLVTDIYDWCWTFIPLTWPWTAFLFSNNLLAYNKCSDILINTQIDQHIFPNTHIYRREIHCHADISTVQEFADWKLWCLAFEWFCKLLACSISSGNAAWVLSTSKRS